MQTMGAEAQQERWNSAVRQYTQSCQAVGKTFDDFFHEIDEQILWV
jgi:hypothetical protein